MKAKIDDSDAHLNAMRLVGDPPVDAIVDAFLAQEPQAVGGLLKELFGTPRMPEAHGLVTRYVQGLPTIELDSPERIVQGQALFDLFGPEALLVLGSCALPLAYAAGSGVQVVARSRRLDDDPIRRLCDTAQMVINVMQPGELEHGKNGWYSARKVRLIHALIRRHVQRLPNNPWDPAWGTPINQEDQAGTLLTFSVGVLHGLRKIGAQFSQSEADAYIFAWAQVGKLLGVDASLLPVVEADAVRLAFKIGARQIRPTPEGKHLSDRLLEAVDSMFPVHGYSTSLAHFFLADTALGANVTSILGIPKPNWTRWLVMLRAAQKRLVLSFLDDVPGAKARRSFVARHLVQRLLLAKHPPGGAPFEVPERLKRLWKLKE